MAGNAGLIGNAGGMLYGAGGVGGNGGAAVAIGGDGGAGGRAGRRGPLCLGIDRIPSWLRGWDLATTARAGRVLATSDIGVRSLRGSCTG